MRRRICRVFALITALVLLLVPCTSLLASQFETNSETGYRAVYDDGAGLIDESGAATLMAKLNAITQYSGIAFVTTKTNPLRSTQALAQYYNEVYFNGYPGVVFLIDMDRRNIYIDTTGSARRTLNSSYANTITDNVYRYASRGDYYSCASNALDQIETLFAGGRIAQPMKHISNLLLSLVLAALINFILVMRASAKRLPTRIDVMGGMRTGFKITNGHEQFLHQSKVYQPPKSDSGGGGGGHSSGGGRSSGGGGGHSGGGHSF